MNILTRKNAEILRFLCKKDGYTREISERLSISPGKVHSAIKLFKKNNLINEKREKNRIIVSLNINNPSLNNILNLIEERKEPKIRLKGRGKASHKGDNGIVLVIGGSRDFIGAPALAGMAALRSGADLAIVAAPEKTAWAINEISPDLITKKLKGDYLSPENLDEMKEWIDRCDSILIGPGLGRRTETREFIKRILKLEKIKIVDADAISAVDLKSLKNSVITPHRREFEILLKNNDLDEKNFQKNLKNNIVLLKGPVDKIISKDKLRLNNTGNEGMTKGGTGDVLAGIAASLAAQGNPLFESAYAAAFINGRAGDNLKSEMGYGFLASDLVKGIPRVMREVLNG